MRSAGGGRARRASRRAPSAPRRPAPTAPAPCRDREDVLALALDAHGAILPNRVERVEVGSGAWCWFADPRAVSGRATYVGWIDGAGDVRVATLEGSGDHLAPALGLGVDDHDNPALLLRADGRLQVFYSAHSGPELFFRDERRRRALGRRAALGPTRPAPRLHLPQPRAARRRRADPPVLARRRLEPRVLDVRDGCAWEPARR